MGHDGVVGPTRSKGNRKMAILIFQFLHTANFQLLTTLKKKKVEIGAPLLRNF